MNTQQKIGVTILSLIVWLLGGAISRMDCRLKALETTQAIQEEPILYRCPDGVLRYISMTLANQYAREENARKVIATDLGAPYFEVPRSDLIGAATLVFPTPTSASATRDRYAPAR